MYKATDDHFPPAEGVKLFFAGTSPGKNMLTIIWIYRCVFVYISAFQPLMRFDTR